MAQINTIQPKPKDDAISLLMKGLSIARDIYGIRADSAKLSEYTKANADREALGAGQLDQQEKLNLEAKGFEIKPAQDGKETGYTDRASGSPLQISAKRDTSPVWVQVQTMKNGVKGTQLFDTKNQAEGAFYPSSPEKEGTRVVETRDANGNPIAAIVPDRPGSTFLKPSSSEGVDFKNVPVQGQVEIRALANKVANQVSISNSIDAQLNNMAKAYKSGNKDQAIVAGEAMLKTLNSDEGKDAVGAEEVKRLGSLLKYQMANFTEPGKFIGRDIEAFFEQAADKSNAIKNTLAANRDRIQEILDGGYSNVPKPIGGKIPKFGSESKEGTAQAAPPSETIRLLRLKAAAGDKQASQYLKTIGE